MSVLLQFLYPIKKPNPNLNPKTNHNPNPNTNTNPNPNSNTNPPSVIMKIW